MTTRREKLEQACALPEPHEHTSMAVYAGHEAEHARLQPLLALLPELVEALEFYAVDRTFESGKSARAALRKVDEVLK